MLREDSAVVPVEKKVMCTIFEDTNGISDISWTPDSRFLLSGGHSREICIWEPETRKKRGGMTGHTEFIGNVNVSPDGKKVLSCAYDSTVRVWDLINEREEQSFSQDISAHAAIWSEDGKTLTTAGKDGIVRFWDLISGKIVRKLACHYRDVTTLAHCSPGTFVTGSMDHSIKIWDIATGKCLDTLHSHSDTVRKVLWNFSHGIVSCSDDKSIVHNRRRIYDTCSIYDVTATGNFSEVVGACRDRSVRIWDTFTGQVKMVLKGFKDWVDAVKYSPDGSCLAAGSSDNTIHVWKCSSLYDRPD